VSGEVHKKNRMIRYIFLLGIIGWAFVAPLYSQKPAELKANGEAAFGEGRWAEAMDFLTQYQAQKPGDLGVLAKIGRSAYYLHQPDQALKYLEYVTLQGKSIDPDTWYALARTLHGVQDWERAIEAYKQFLRLAPDTHPYRANVRDNLKRCVTGMTSVANLEVALIENPGAPINSPGDEFAPLPSPNYSDRLYFSASTPESTGGRRNDDGYEDLKTGHWCSDMYVSKRTTRGWEDPQPFSSLQNTARFEYAADFTNDGRVMCFYRGFTLYGGQFLTDTAGQNDEYRSEATVLDVPVRPLDGDVAPFYFNDNTLLFASRREGGQGGLDLWATQWADTAWAAPVNLGPGVNSAYDETTPFVAADGKTLFFSSNRLSSIGGLDVFSASFDPAKQEWSAVSTMGVGVNSPGDDAFFRLAADGSTATFASNRITDNLGERDLYIAYFKNPMAVQSESKAPEFAFFDQKTAQQEEDAIQKIVFTPLFYTNDRDLTNTENLQMLNQAAIALRQHPTAILTVTCHTDNGSLPKFDLFAGIKRAESVAKTLTDRLGVTPDRLLVRSAGQTYPLARNIVDGAPNTAGQRFNRRVDLTLGLHPLQSSSQTKSFVASIIRPEMAQQMQAAGTSRLDAQDKGLLYRVEFANTRQVLTSDALSLLTDVMVELPTGGGAYRYLAGAERTYAKAQPIKKDLEAQGFKDVVIVAYVDGIRIERNEAARLLKKHPDLSGYMRG
jgi:outer membrane protein OmpA-like peptidoglycan-associated protein/tetratricopeptide (TPR) repeat protein